MAWPLHVVRRGDRDPALDAALDRLGSSLSSQRDGDRFDEAQKWADKWAAFDPGNEHAQRLARAARTRSIDGAMPQQPALR